MAENDRRRSSTGVDRRASIRYSADARDDDDYDLEAMGISDGFRPAMDTNTTGGFNPNRMSSQMSRTTPRPRTPPPRPSSISKPSRINSFALQHDGETGPTRGSTTTSSAGSTSTRPSSVSIDAPGRRTPPPRPSSISKPRGPDSFALRHDGEMGSAQPRSSMMMSGAGPTPTRSSSVSTDAPFMRPESPYRGPTGPSHPYQMYAQESQVGRTASVMTASTVAVPEGPYSGPAGPTHPYGMYPQNTVDPELQEAPPIPPIPVGFPGLNNNYQRRLGPEGEEIADMIGPDGHTEQLPPYTQYPDQAFVRKARPDALSPIVGAGGIGLATRNPEFASQEDLSSPQSRRSSRTNISSSDGDSHHDVNMAALGNSSEKPELKKWQQIARRKIFGIVPVWALALAAIVLVLFVVILVTTLAIFKPKDHKKTPYVQDPTVQSMVAVTTTMTTTFDASPITSAPPNLPTLPTGSYAVPISAPSAVQNSCLSNTQQSPAWSCSVPMSQYTVEIEGIPGDGNGLDNNQISLTLGNTTFGGYYPYGTQPPVLKQIQQLHLVIDSQIPDRGPAWFFEMKYDKLVIVPEAGLSVTNSKRDLEIRDPSNYVTSDFAGKKSVAQPFDKPWFCYWNGTLLEAFIYVNLSSSAATQSSGSGTASQTSSTCTSSAPTKTSQAPSSSTSGAQQLPKFPSAYPKVMKIEERRVPNSYPPYCVQQFIDANGDASPILNSTNQPITIYLNETEGTSVSQISGKRSNDKILVEERSATIKARQSSANCGCVWLWT